MKYDAYCDWLHDEIFALFGRALKEHHAEGDFSPSEAAIQAMCELIAELVAIGRDLQHSHAQHFAKQFGEKIEAEIMKVAVSQNNPGKAGIHLQ